MHYTNNWLVLPVLLQIWLSALTCLWVHGVAELLCTCVQWFALHPEACILFVVPTVRVLCNQAMMPLKHWRCKNLLFLAPEVLHKFYMESYLGNMDSEILRRLFASTQQIRWLLSQVLKIRLIRGQGGCEMQMTKKPSVIWSKFYYLETHLLHRKQLYVGRNGSSMAKMII